MTVIAWKDGIVCADSRSTYEDGSIELCDKLFRIRKGPNRGCIVATQGSSSPGMKYVEHFTDPKKEAPHIEFEDDTFTCVVFRQDATVWTVDQHGCLVQCVEPYFSIGAGAPVALGAMDMGASAIRAVRIACRRNSLCGPPIKWINFKPTSILNPKLGG